MQYCIQIPLATLLAARYFVLTKIVSRNYTVVLRLILTRQSLWLPFFLPYIFSDFPHSFMPRYASISYKYPSLVNGEGSMNVWLYCMNVKHNKGKKSGIMPPNLNNNNNLLLLMLNIACFPKCSNSQRWAKTRGKRGCNSHYYPLIISPWNSLLLFMFKIACFPKCSNSQRWVKTRGRRGYNSHFYPRIISPWHPLLLFMLKIAYPARGFITEGKIYICIHLHKANRSYNTWFLFQDF